MLFPLTPFYLNAIFYIKYGESKKKEMRQCLIAVFMMQKDNGT